MGIVKFTAVGIRSNLRTPCRGGAFNVKVIVLGTVNKRGGAFKVSLWDDDTLADDLLAESKLIPANVLNKKKLAGVFRNVVHLTLDCDGACDVRGPEGSSGDNPASVYAYVEDSAVGGAKPAESQRLSLVCVPPKDSGEKSVDDVPRPDDDFAGQVKDGLWTFPHFELPVDGGNCETARGVTLDLPPGAVEPGTKVVVSRMPPELEREFFPEDIGIDMRTLQIGDFGTAFAKPIKVNWKLNAAEQRLLDERDGSVVVFDAEENSWTRFENALVDGEQVRFQTERGGVFAVASHSVFNEFVSPLPGMCRPSR